MTRIWLLLLLVLSLTPTGLSASWDTPVGEPEPAHAAEGTLHGSHALRADDAHHGSHALRSSSGLELVWRSESHGLGCVGGCSRHRSSGDGAPDAYVLLSGARMLARARLLSGPGRADIDAVAPLCESLPYFATAPPSLR